MTHTELTVAEIEAAVDRMERGEITDAIRSAGRAVYIYTNGATAEEYDDAHPHEVWSEVKAATAAIAAARPHIEAEVERLQAEAAQSRRGIDHYVGALGAEHAENERMRAKAAADDQLISDMRVRVVAWEQALGVTILPTIDDPDPQPPAARIAEGGDR